MNKTKILWLIIIVLAVLNITTIATIIIQKKNVEGIIFEPDSKPITEECFREGLNFDNNQMEVYINNNKIFRQQANRIIQSINDQKEAMFSELQNCEPDTLKLKKLSEEIGTLHAELKYVTVKFYLSLNEVCNTEQKEQQKNIFKPLFDKTPLPKSSECSQDYEQGYKKSK